MFDVAIIGGGPAGLSACVNAACEGLEAILIAKDLGGQAGTSSRIENFLGFPQGISGPSLTDRACRQAQKFGAQIHDGSVESVRFRDGRYELRLVGGTRIKARALIIAVGATYNRPDWAIPFERGGIHYACTANVVRAAGHETVAVVGGGNSAGQAALFLASKVKHVYLIIRGDDIAKGMSFYLYERLEELDNVEILLNTEVKQGLANSKGRLGGLEFTNGKSISISDAYVMIGAKPHCDFLGDLVETDHKGFVTTNQVFETSRPGAYAVGDIRAGSIKRVANAAGEGAACVQGLFHYLEKLK